MALLRRPAAALFLTALVLAGCEVIWKPEPTGSPPPAAIPNPLRVYSSLPLTGASRAQSVSMVNAIRMAFDDRGGKDGTNAAIGGPAVQYQPLDDGSVVRNGWDADAEAANARAAASDPAAIGYLGPLNAAAARVAIPILGAAGLPLIAPSGGPLDLTAGGGTSGPRTYFRVMPNEAVQGSVGARWMRDLKVTSVFVVDDGSAYGTAIAAAFEAAARTVGLRVVARETSSPAGDAEALARRIVAADPLGVYVSGTTDTMVALLKRVRELMPKVVAMGPDGVFDDAAILQLGAAGEGLYATLAGTPPDRYVGRQAAWRAAYLARYGAEPAHYAIYAYEAACVLLDAARRVGGDRTRMVDAVRRTGTSYDGILGRWSFDANGDTTLTGHSGFVVRGGKWAFAQSLE